jgi:hypothetical protein
VLPKLRQDEGLLRQGSYLEYLDLTRLGQTVIGRQCEQQPFLLDDRSRDAIRIILTGTDQADI